MATTTKKVESKGTKVATKVAKTTKTTAKTKVAKKVESKATAKAQVVTKVAKKIPLQKDKVEIILEQRGAEYGSFMDSVARMNALMQSARSALPPLSQNSTMTLIALKMVRIIKLLKDEIPLENIKSTDSYLDLQGYIRLMITNFKPSFAYFAVSDLDDCDLKAIKEEANALFYAEIIKNIETEEKLDSLLE